MFAFELPDAGLEVLNIGARRGLLGQTGAGLAGEIGRAAILAGPLAVAFYLFPSTSVADLPSPGHQYHF